MMADDGARRVASQTVERTDALAIGWPAGEPGEQPADQSGLDEYTQAEDRIGEAHLGSPMSDVPPSGTASAPGRT